MIEDVTFFILLTGFIFDLVLGTKYVYFDQTATWDEARQICQSHGYVMAKIVSADDQMLVKTQRYMWIGLKIDESQTWTDSTPLNYRNWAEGFPGYSNGLNCARVIPQDFTWETSNCSFKISFLCQTTVYHPPNVVTDETKIKGLMLGACLVGGLVLLLCLCLQTTCCRIRALDRLKNTLETSPMI